MDEANMKPFRVLNDAIIECYWLVRGRDDKTVLGQMTNGSGLNGFKKSGFQCWLGQCAGNRVQFGCTTEQLHRRD